MTATDDLVREFEFVCQSVVNRYFPPPGLSRDDLLQEARIGLMEALRGYQPDHGASLKTFVYLAVEREVITAIKTATRQKHEPLNKAVRSAAGADGDASSIFDLIEDNSARPDFVLEAAEETTLIDHAMERAGLSQLEAKCLAYVLEQGGTYADAASALQLSEKSVDNALQRVRLKLARIGAALEQEAA